MKKIIATILSLTTVFALGLALVSPLPANALLDANKDLGLDKAVDTGLGNQDIRTTISKVIKTTMSLLGIIAVVIVLIGGFKWMTAGGNDEQVGEAKKWIFSGIIGLAIILSAYALASFIINQLVTATA